jgi:hypothetical protein
MKLYLSVLWNYRLRRMRTFEKGIPGTKFKVNPFSL